LRRGADRHGLPGAALYGARALSRARAARSDPDGGGADARRLADRILLHRGRACAQEHHRRHADHGVHLRARLLPSAADPRPATALDTLGAHHRSGDLPVEHAVRRRHGRVPGARHTRSRRTHGLCRPQGRSRMNALLQKVYFGLIGLFLSLPIIVVAGVSVNEKQTLAFPPQGFSLGWYGEIFTNPEWRNALFASLTLAALSAVLALAIALPLAWFLWRRHAPWANIFQLLGIAPFTLPPVITALGLLTFWATTGFY